jgi:hypothetical protein
MAPISDSLLEIGPQTPEDQAEAWEGLVEEKSLDAFLAAWLTIQAGNLQNIRRALVALVEDGEAVSVVSTWPPATSVDTLIALAKSAAKERRGLVRKRPTAAPDRRASSASAAYPIVVADVVRMVVAVEVADNSDSELRDLLRQLQWGSGWLRQRQAAESVQGQQAPRLTLELFASLVESKTIREGARKVATELAVRLAADRVSVTVQRSRRMRLVAISHAADFDQKLALSRAIEAAADEAGNQAAIICWPESDPDQVFVTRDTQALGKLASGKVVTVPLLADADVVGAIVVEGGSDDVDGIATPELLDGLGAALAPALVHLDRASAPFPVKAARTMANGLRFVLGPRALGAKLLLIAASALVALCFLISVDFEVSASAKLEGATVRSLGAAFDGFVLSAEHKAGQEVAQGTLLAKLDDRDLRLELSRQEASLNQRGIELDRAVSSGKMADAGLIRAQARQVEVQLELLRTMVARAEIRAPFDGLIVAGDLTQQVGAPVKRGDVLFRLAPLEDYRLKIDVPEADIGLVSIGQRGHVLLSALPYEPFEIEVMTVTPITLARDGVNVFEVDAKVLGVNSHLRPGMEGTAKLDDRPRTLAWIWGRSLIEWVEMRKWQWLP